MNEVQAAAYLAGMIDGEGNVMVRQNRWIAIANTEWDLIEATARCCELLGLRYRIDKAYTPKNKPTWKPAWRVVITGRSSFEKVRDIVPIQSRRKAAAVVDAIATFKRNHIVRPSKEWLTEQYWDNGLTLDEVGKLAGAAGAGSVLPWFQQYGIPRRSDGEAQFHHHQRRVAELEQKEAQSGDC